MFVPVQIGMNAGHEQSMLYDRSIELTSRQMEAFARAAGDMTEPLSEIGSDLHVAVSAQFATEGAQGATGAWAPLSEAYGEWKQARSAAPILVGLSPVDKGTRESPTRPQTYEPSGMMRRQLLDPLATHVTPRRMLYAPDSDIAGYHETGTEKMPARPPVDLGATFLHSLDRTFVSWIARLVERHGL